MPFASPFSVVFQKYTLVDFLANKNEIKISRLKKNYKK